MRPKQTLQKVLAVFILLLVPFFLLKEYKSLVLHKKFALSAYENLIKNEYAQEEDKSFVLMIFPDKDHGYCEKNLESIFSQSYSQFRVVYLYKEDPSYFKALSFVKTWNHQAKVEFIKNKTDKDMFSSFYKALHSCKDEEIVVHLESCDWLADEHVLEKLNKAYKDPDVWLTYADCVNYPSLEKQGLKATVNRNLRDFRSDKTPWMLSHLKTYYAGLLKQLTPSLEEVNEKAISKEDKLLMLSLLKIGKWHVRFIPEALSVHQE